MKINDLISKEELIDHNNKMINEIKEKTANIIIKIECNQKTLELFKNCLSPKDKLIHYYYGVPVYLNDEIPDNKLNIHKKNGKALLVDIGGKKK
jgi:hypothetical protein